MIERVCIARTGRCLRTSFVDLQQGSDLFRLMEVMCLERKGDCIALLKTYGCRKSAVEVARHHLLQYKEVGVVRPKPMAGSHKEEKHEACVSEPKGRVLSTGEM